MIEGRTIVCLASAWDYDPTSKHQIMKILAERNQIIWVNYHGTRRPNLNGKDLRAAWSALRRFARGIVRVSPNFVHMTPLVVPGVTDPLLGSVHRRLLVNQIRRAIRTVPGASDRPLQIWSFAPDVACLIDRFRTERFVYYCVDDYAGFEGLDSERIMESENTLVDRADVVITTSELLYRSKLQRRSDVALVRHGVDFDHFASAWRNPPPRPDDIAGINRPIFGFFGLIHFWIDRALMAALARSRPQYAFVLIGDRATSTAELDGLPNVYFLGRRPNAELPAYCAAFRAGLMPFVRSSMTRSVNPIKMYEYLAAGLPTISTRLPEVERFAGPVIIADTAEAFAQACDRFAYGELNGTRQKISRYVAAESWRSKVEVLSRIVMDGEIPDEAPSTLQQAAMPAEELFPHDPQTASPAPEASSCATNLRLT
ncbi:MAG: glycosyltransferase [Phycisphaerae bacterium]|nr:glycosyltransferase [Phycisphaerae bacterium]